MVLTTTDLARCVVHLKGLRHRCVYRTQLADIIAAYVAEAADVRASEKVLFGDIFGMHDYPPKKALSFDVPSESGWCWGRLEMRERRDCAGVLSLIWSALIPKRTRSGQL